LKESQKKYMKLQWAIKKNGGVVCEQVPHIFFPEDWVVCEQVPHIFFPEDSYNTDNGYFAEKKLALKICSQCPVQQLCADYAMTAREPYGIWGGTTPTDR